jgi:SPP1 gp7 family putative phage head morphogenesis protein
MAVSPVLAASRSYQAQLASYEAAATQRLIDNYLRSLARIDALLNRLLLEIGDRRPSAAQLKRMQTYQRLIEQITAELVALQVATGNEIENTAQIMPELGERNNRAIMALMLLLLAGIVNPTPAQIAEASSRFVPVLPDDLAILTEWLRPGGMLYDRLRMLSGTNIQATIDAILEGVRLGRNPRVIADAVRKMFGRGLADALRFVRTAQLWAYREANRASMVANQDVLEGWVWSAAFDERTCMSCVVMHGTIHPVDEALNDHHNGRCVAIPLVIGFPNPVEQTGLQWFEQQSEATQRALMGPGKYDAWRSGSIRLDQLTEERRDDVYGLMRVEPSLKSLLGVEQ